MDTACGLHCDGKKRVVKKPGVTQNDYNHYWSSSLLPWLWGLALGWFISYAKVQANEKMAGGIIEAARKEVEKHVCGMRGAKAQDDAFKAS